MKPDHYTVRTARQRKPTRSASSVVRALIEIIDDTPLSYAVIADHAGFHKNTIDKMRRGEASPSIATLEAFASVVGAEIIVRKKT